MVHFFGEHLLVSEAPVAMMKTHLLCVQYLFWLCLFALSSAQVSLHSLSAGNIIIGFVSQTWSSVTVYVISKGFAMNI